MLQYSKKGWNSLWKLSKYWHSMKTIYRGNIPVWNLQSIFSFYCFYFIYSFFFSFWFFYKGSGKILDHKYTSGKFILCLLAEQGARLSIVMPVGKEREQVGVELTLNACYLWGTLHKLLHLNPNENLWGINPCTCFIHKGNQTQESPATCLRWGSGRLWWDVNSDLSAPSMIPVHLPQRKVFHANQNIRG